jgi:hypothetical protein
MLLKAFCPRRESSFAPIFVLGCILITGGIVNAISRDFAPAIGQFNTGEKIGSFSGKEVRMDCGEQRIRIVLGKPNVAGRHVNHVGPTAISADLRWRAQITPTHFDLLHAIYQSDCRLTIACNARASLGQILRVMIRSHQPFLANCLPVPAAKDGDNAQRLLTGPFMRRKTSAPKRRQFVPFCRRIPCHQFNLGHSLHQSNSLRMITSERQQVSMRLDVPKRY